jgi:photosystem II stability/assembly factor-like uncharacterized protein
MRIKIHLVFLLIFAINSGLFGQYFWQKINSPTDYFLRTLQFADSSKGWVAGDSGLIFYTSDGGLNWEQQQTGNNHKIMKLFFLDENRGWAVAWDETGNNNFYGTYILKTTNGGETWNSEQYREEYVFLATIYFLDSLKGFMGGYPGKFLITTDGGSNWENAQIDSGAFAHLPPVHFNFFNEQYGFAAGGALDIAGVVWKTTNGGQSWKPLSVGSPDPIRAMHFFDSLNVFGIGGDPEFFGIGIVRSTDAGESWTYEEPGLIGVATSLSFRTETEGWSPTSFAQTLIYSFDSGNTWADTSTVDSSSIYDLVFTDSLTGYAVGEEGVILKYNYQYPTYLKEEITVTKDFNLYHNYPNPFNSSTTIDYQISKPSQVSLRIYNVLGSLITNLVEGYKLNGNYSEIWNAGNATSGIYYLQLNVNGNLLTRKMLLLK